ncbi:MAG TPA: CinA family nicotinamide mononucleotide deamidase-related protein [Candidatus Cloacimonetes bacterium]|nr:CinA family nicotinamide mononucleotide deamidase-related protein [Candidatus Cloacimonadota bacterium]
MEYKSAVISIGNELLIGKTINGNMGFLGSELAAMGFPVDVCEMINDERDAILESITRCWEKYDVVITTGGLGPTEDDITRNVIADFFGKKLQFDDEVWEHITKMFKHRRTKMADSNKVQAMIPEDFTVLRNDRGTAPGLYYSEGGKHFFALPGVPAEMTHLFNFHLREILKDNFDDISGMVQQDLHTFGVSESGLAEMISEKELPEGAHLAWLPQTGRVDLRIYGSDMEALKAAREVVVRKAGEFIWAIDAESPAAVLLDWLKERKLKLAIAESCTGGWVQKHITAVPGSSEAYLGGVVSYSNESKMKLLGVKESTLAEHGAVSSETVLEMARGVKELFDADISIAVTGVAGPDGGTEVNPVGTVYFGFRVGDKSFEAKQISSGGRDRIRHRAAEAAILFLYNFLMDE